jgi:carboxylesterase type B
MAAIAAGLSISHGTTVTEPRHTSPRVDLGYASYEGTTLENGVHQFLGMRYAAPPLGENRFRRAQNPLNETHIVSATKASGQS